MKPRPSESPAETDPHSMGAYILKRILLMTFAVIQFVPGGPVEQVIAKMQGTGSVLKPT